MSLNRRSFLRAGVAVAGSLSAPAVLAEGHGRPRVMVIGGGAGGATAARYIAKDGGIDVTLIEPTKTYFSCFFSNLYLGGVKELNALGHTYGTLAAVYRINVVHDWAVEVDRAAKTITLAGGETLDYDKLILSPGIDFVEGAVDGWSLAAQNAMPHAYKGAGSQTELLKAQVEAMPQGGIFAMIAPPDPYRCPPGPYERVSMVAHVLSQINPTAKIIVADPKPKFSKMSLFEEGWAKYYPGMIDWIGEDFGGGNVSVDPDAMMLSIDGDQMAVDVCNVIPAMKAGRIAEIAGVTQGDWAPVHARDMSARADPDIYILGDASEQGDMPKSGFSANSQAKVCANAVRGALLGASMTSAEYSNTCWSLIAPNDAVKVGATYRATEEKIERVDGFISQPGETAQVREKTYHESEGWYAGMTADMFT